MCCVCVIFVCLSVLVGLLCACYLYIYRYVVFARSFLRLLLYGVYCVFGFCVCVI